MNTLTSKALARFIFGVGILTASFACAQPIDSFSEHLLNRVSSPIPAAYDARTNQLITGTIRGEVRKIAEPNKAGRRVAERLYRSPGNSILRIRLDTQRQRLWILDIGNVHVFDLARNRLIRSIALPNWLYAGHGTNCLPDLQVDAHGAAFVSDNIQPKLWRIDAADFSVYERTVSLDSQHSVDAGFSALAIGEGGVMFAAMAAPGSLWRIDTDLFRAEHIPLREPIHGACAMETSGVARSRELTLFVLTAQRAGFALVRIDSKLGVAQAQVIPVASTSSPASLVARNGALYLATDEVRLSHRERAHKVHFALRPVYGVE